MDYQRVHCCFPLETSKHMRTYSDTKTAVEGFCCFLTLIAVPVLNLRVASAVIYVKKGMYMWKLLQILRYFFLGNY